jgi:hypothetical protein
MNQAKNQVESQKFVIHKETGDRIVLHPFEQERSILNPHGFIEMEPLYKKFIELFEKADKQNFTATFENNRNFLNIACNYQPDLQASISLVEVSYGAIRKVPNRSSEEPIVKESVHGSLIFAFYRKSKSVSVMLAKDGNGNSLLPNTFLRSINLNDFLNLPLVDFEQNPVLSLA